MPIPKKITKAVKKNLPSVLKLSFADLQREREALAVGMRDQSTYSRLLLDSFLQGNISEEEKQIKLEIVHIGHLFALRTNVNEGEKKIDIPDNVAAKNKEKARYFLDQMCEEYNRDEKSGALLTGLFVWYGIVALNYLMVDFQKAAKVDKDFKLLSIELIVFLSYFLEQNIYLLNSFEVKIIDLFFFKLKGQSGVFDVGYKNFAYARNNKANDFTRTAKAMASFFVKAQSFTNELEPKNFKYNQELLSRFLNSIKDLLNTNGILSEQVDRKDLENCRFRVVLALRLIDMVVLPALKIYVEVNKENNPENDIYKILGDDEKSIFNYLQRIIINALNNISANIEYDAEKGLKKLSSHVDSYMLQYIPSTQKSIEGESSPRLALTLPNMRSSALSTASSSVLLPILAVFNDLQNSLVSNKDEDNKDDLEKTLFLLNIQNTFLEKSFSEPINLRMQANPDFALGKMLGDIELQIKIVNRQLEQVQERIKAIEEKEQRLLEQEKNRNDKEFQTKKTISERVYDDLMAECTLNEEEKEIKEDNLKAERALKEAIKAAKREKKHAETVAEKQAKELAKEQKKSEETEQTAKVKETSVRKDSEGAKDLLLKKISELPTTHKLFLRKDDPIIGYDRGQQVSKSCLIFDSKYKDDIWQKIKEEITGLSKYLEAKEQKLFKLQCDYTMAAAFLAALEIKERLGYLSVISYADNVFSLINEFYSKVEQYLLQKEIDIDEVIRDSFKTAIKSGRERLETLERNILEKAKEHYEKECAAATAAIRRNIANGKERSNNGPSVRTIERRRLHNSISTFSKKLAVKLDLPVVTYKNTLRFMRTTNSATAQSGSMGHFNPQPHPEFNPANFPELGNANFAGSSNTTNFQSTAERKITTGAVATNEDMNPELYCEIGIEHFPDENRYLLSTEYSGQEISTNFHYKSLEDEVILKSSEGEDIILTIEKFLEGDLGRDENDINTPIDISRKNSLHQLIISNANRNCFAIGTNAYVESKSSRIFNYKYMGPINYIAPGPMYPGSLAFEQQQQMQQVEPSTYNFGPHVPPPGRAVKPSGPFPSDANVEVVTIRGQESPGTSKNSSFKITYNGRSFIVPEDAYVEILNIPGENKYIISTDDFGERLTINLYYRDSNEQLKLSSNELVKISDLENARDELKSSLYKLILNLTLNDKKTSNIYTNNYLGDSKKDEEKHTYLTEQELLARAEAIKSRYVNISGGLKDQSGQVYFQAGIPKSYLNAQAVIARIKGSIPQSLDSGGNHGNATSTTEPPANNLDVATAVATGELSRPGSPSALG